MTDAKRLSGPPRCGRKNRKKKPSHRPEFFRYFDLSSMLQQKRCESTKIVALNVNIVYEKRSIAFEVIHGVKEKGFKRISFFLIEKSIFLNFLLRRVYSKFFPLFPYVFIIYSNNCTIFILQDLLKPTIDFQISLLFQDTVLLHKRP